MLFNSIDYLVFFPVVVLIYFIIPKKIKYLWLLAASYFFYMCWNIKYVLLIIFSTLVTYICGLVLDKIKDGGFDYKREIYFKKLTVTVSILLNMGMLFYFKYINFVIVNVCRTLNIININVNARTFDITLPVGISFFTFQALGYTIDVYRGEIKAEKNPFRYALFVSFFPQLVAGPIERSKNLLVQLRQPKNFDVDNARMGLLTMAYGLFLKIVIADNISPIVDSAFASPEDYTGMCLFFATILFAFQIYCDFEGYTKIAIGSAKILGCQLNKNFDSPYFAISVKDFWRRWHISLTSWFRDYLYIPLGGSKRGKFRKQFNTIIIFLCSGLWHGAAWHYVIWGGLNGLFSIFEDITKPIKENLFMKLKITKDAFGYRLFQRVFTFLLVDFTWLFFRAESLHSALNILRKIVLDFKWEWFLIAGYAELFDSVNVLMIIVVSLLLIFVVDLFNYMGKDIKSIILNQQMIFRWICYWLFLMLIMYWGVFGTEYEQTQFIYFQF